MESLSDNNSERNRHHVGKQYSGYNSSRSSGTYGFGNVLRSLTRPFRVTPAVTSRIRPTVVGGTGDLDKLLEIVNQSSNVMDKKTASEMIRASIEERSISSIPEIWYAAKDLIDSRQEPETRRAGLKLMNSCISHDEHAVGTRVSYFKTIIDHWSLEDFDLQLECLKTVTNNGRDLIDLYQSGFPLPEKLTIWLRDLACESQDIRIGRKKDLAAPYGTTTQENFHDLLKYIINTLKFNIAAYDEHDIEVLLKEAVNICRKTSKQDDLELCCDLIDTAMVYGIIPISVLRNILEVFCGTSVTVPDLAEKVWDSVNNLAHSHIGNNTVLCLCQILEATDRREVNSNTMRGAARFLLRLIHSLGINPVGDLLDVPIPRILIAYKRSLEVESTRHSLEICSCIYDLVKDETSRKFITYEIWESTDYSPFEVIYTLSRSTIIQQKSRRSVGRFFSEPNSIIPGTATVSKILEKLQQFFDLLTLIIADKSFKGPNEVAIDFLLDMSDFIDERSARAVIDHFESQHYCNPLSKSWSSNTLALLKNFYLDTTWPSFIRVRVIRIILDICAMSRHLDDPLTVEGLLEKLFSTVNNEQDVEVIHYLMDLFIYVSTYCSFELLVKLGDLLMKVFVPAINVGKSRNTSIDGGRVNLKLNTDIRFDITRSISRTMAELFVKTFRFSPRKSRYYYFNLVTICQKSQSHNSGAFIEAAKVLCRIRATEFDYIYLTEPLYTDDLIHICQMTKRENSPQLWGFPEKIDYLTDDIIDIPSTLLRRRIQPVSGYDQEYRLKEHEYEIDMSFWLNTLLNVVEDATDWDIYSYIWCHFPSQMINIRLFSGCTDEIRRMMIVLCDQVTNSKVPQSLAANFNQEISKQDILVIAVKVLSYLVAYQAFFTRGEQETIVSALIQGLTTYDKTSVPCIDALQVCCYEFPHIMQKYIGAIFTKLQTKITVFNASASILEFLLSLAQLPTYYESFSQEEYKRVFGIVFTYIQHSNDKSQNAAETDERNKILSQYYLSLAYSAIARWFICLKVVNRKYMAPYITRNLILANHDSSNIDDQSLATLDLISRFTYSNLDLTMQQALVASTKDNVILKRWVYGSSILSIECDSETGESLFVSRRPTGTTIFKISPHVNILPQKIINTFISKANTDLLADAFSPSYYLLQLILPNDPLPAIKPVPLRDDPLSQRAISSFDRTPVVDFYKVGIMYIGYGQFTESEILSNETGSRKYRDFLNELGSLVRLKGNKSIYTGGLDVENDIDGKYGYYWNDKITQIMFHTTTLMPNPKDPNDRTFASKKRHIGNNAVNIFFNESGKMGFDFNTIKSQFNFVNIVITAQKMQFQESLDKDEPTPPPDSDRDFELIGRSERKNYYLVKVYQKEGVPQVFSACSVKLLSEERLPMFVRNLILAATKYATVWHSDGMYISNWRYRLQQINILKERIEAQLQKELEEEEAENNNDKNDVGSSFLDQLTGGQSTSGGAVSGEGGLTSGNGANVEGIEITSSNGPQFVKEVDLGPEIVLMKSLDFTKFA